MNFLISLFYVSPDTRPIHRDRYASGPSESVTDTATLNHAKWRAAIRNCREWNRHGRLSTLTSPFSYLTFHRGCSCSWFRRGCLQILFSFTAWSSFLLSNSDEAQLGKGSGLHLQRFHLITCLNSSEREISKMDWWKTIKMFPSFFLWPYTFTNRHVHDRG